MYNKLRENLKFKIAHTKIYYGTHICSYFSFQTEQEGPSAEEAFDFFTKTW